MRLVLIDWPKVYQLRREFFLTLGLLYVPTLGMMLGAFAGWNYVVIIELCFVLAMLTGWRYLTAVQGK